MSRGRFVLDNSVVIAWYLRDEFSVLADNILGSLADNDAIVPAVWPLELGNALLVAERRGRIGTAEVTRVLNLVENLPISVQQENPRRMLTDILAMARELNLSTYDASYLDLAMRTASPLATLDRNMLSAAAKCGVPKYAPSH